MKTLRTLILIGGAWLLLTAATPTVTPTATPTVTLSSVQSPGAIPTPLATCIICVQDLTLAFPKSCANNTILPIPVGHILEFTHTGLGNDSVQVTDGTGISGSPHSVTFTNVPAASDVIVNETGLWTFSVVTSGCATNLITVIGQ